MQRDGGECLTERPGKAYRVFAEGIHRFIRMKGWI